MRPEWSVFFIVILRRRSRGNVLLISFQCGFARIHGFEKQRALFRRQFAADDQVTAIIPVVIALAIAVLLLRSLLFRLYFFIS